VKHYSHDEFESVADEMMHDQQSSAAVQLTDKTTQVPQKKTSSTGNNSGLFRLATQVVDCIQESL